MKSSLKVIVQKDSGTGFAADPSTFVRDFQPNDKDGLSEADVFVREVVQNILDLSSPEERELDVKAVFEEKVINKDHLGLLKSLLGKDDLDKLNRYGKLIAGSKERSGFNEFLDGKEIPCVVISDHTENTKSPQKGMWGTVDPHGLNVKQDSKSTLERYCVSIGYSDPNKGLGKSVGGHGIGKVANALASKDKFYVLYTYTNEENKDGSIGVHKCIGLGVDEHREKHHMSASDFKYFNATTGHMYLSACGFHGEDFPFELRGEEAKKLASSFGIDVREKGDYGTSMCIFNCRFGVDEITDSYHKFFFPAHFGVKKAPEVIFIKNNGDRKVKKEPSFDPLSDLGRFIHCYKLIVDDETKSDDDKLTPLGLTKSCDIKEKAGAISFSKFDEEVEDAELRNKMALVRGFMVINYFVPTSKTPIKQDFACCYVPDEEAINIHKALSLAEPPKHHVWSEDSDRLKKHPELQDLVKYVNKVTRRHLNSFINEMKPGKSYKTKRDTEIAKRLAKIFTPVTGKDGQETQGGLKSATKEKVSLVSESIEGGFKVYTFKGEVCLSDNFNPNLYVDPYVVQVKPKVIPLRAKSKEPTPLREVGTKVYLDKLTQDFEIAIDQVVTFEFEAITSAEEVMVNFNAEIISQLKEKELKVAEQ